MAETSDKDNTSDTPQSPGQDTPASARPQTELRPLTRSERRNIWIKEYSDQDIALSLWVEWTEKLELELPVMLQIHGLLVFGTMISTATYASFHIQLYEEMYREQAPDTADVLHEYFRGLVPPQDGPEIGAEGLPVLFNAIHLRDVSIFNAGHKIQVPYWRGKVSQVDAFVLGATAES